ncbi:MAG: Bax inhibitor-1/YccA family protein [Candidatus Marinimicrobia bacterium]|nr:Bax inhibitor-1/YccA family protein [Candidatus Neomarinimicrobiota bacterium]
MTDQRLTMSPEAIAAEQQGFMVKVFGWMGGGLLVSGLVATWVATNVGFIGMGTFIVAAVIQLVVVIGLVSRVERMSATMATGLFIFYSALTGVTLSTLLLIYTAESVASTFVITAGVFGVMAFYGYTTKKDLTGWGSFLFMGLIGIILASVVNMFMRSSAMGMVISYVGVLIFTGLTAYDVQKIKSKNVLGNAGTDEDTKEAVIGALALYLDFINLFIMLLRITGSRR